jgi:2,3-bisphosphoglycerate-dependent phosphoglycerate mutase
MIPRTLSRAATAVPAVSESIEPTANPSLWLVRHGQSTWNTAGICQGHNDDAELTERGLAQAAGTAAGFRDRRIRAVYSSDLRRARQTAAAFAAVLGLPVLIDARLRERSFGVLEGTPLATVDPALTGVADGLVIDPDARPPGGESVRDFYLRAAAFADALAAELRQARDALPGDVLAIAHGGTLRVLDAYLHGISVDQMTWPPVSNATTLRIADFGTTSRGGNR